MIVVFKNLEKKIYEECNYMDSSGYFIVLEKRWKVTYSELREVLVYLKKDEVLYLEPLKKVKAIG